MGGHGGGGCTHITCINMPIQNKYHRIVAHVSSVQICIMWQQWHTQVVSVWLLEQFYTHVIIDAS